jgi:glycosyltransferase involved in cell wall biosynthesis
MNSEKQVFEIAFCVTCRNRLWQLKQTLQFNLSQLNPKEMISLVDFGSSDGLSEWIWTNFELDINQNKLLFFEVKNKVHWNVAKAKNLAHRIAEAKYVFNLDADNKIHKSDIELIKKCAEENKVSHQFSGHWPDGSFGRIGLAKELFLKIGGYDESMLAMGGQDMDILARLSKLKVKIYKLPSPTLLAIANSIEDKVANIKRGQLEARPAYDMLNKTNLTLSKIRLATEGPIKLGGFSSYLGLLNGRNVMIDGFDNISYI